MCGEKNFNRKMSSVNSMLRSMPDHSKRGWLVQGEFDMKIRNVLLGIIAFVVLAGSVVPANAAGHRHHHGHGHHHKG